MGIRYYAYPVKAEDIDHARTDPISFISDDPLMDAWGAEEDRPRMLYLDKAWQPLQRLFVDRPSSSLVSGNVRWSDRGYEPWVKVLDPEEVAEVARDIVLVEPVDADSDVLQRMHWDAEGVNQYLTSAQQFVTELVEEDSGLVYIIG